MVRANNRVKTATPPPPMTEHEIIAKKKKEAAKEKQREATRLCRKRKAEELAEMEERKKVAMNQNKKLLEQIDAIEKLMEWMHNAVNARQNAIVAQQQYSIPSSAISSVSPYSNIPSDPIAAAPYVPTWDGTMIYDQHPQNGAVFY